MYFAAFCFGFMLLGTIVLVLNKRSDCLWPVHSGSVLFFSLTGGTAPKAETVPAFRFNGCAGIELYVDVLSQ